MKKTTLLFALASSACAFAGALEDGFANPPNENKPRVWWHWMNGNVSKAGITADLEAMAKAGIGGAHLFDVGCDIPAGPVAFNTPAWDEHVTWAAKEAERLGLEITLVNSSGYSSSGGPWVKPEDAMKSVTFSEAVVKGGETFAGVLPPKGKESGFYADVATLAFPLPPSENEGGADATLLSTAIGTNEFLVSASKPYVAYGFTLSITYDVWRWDQALKATVWTSDDGKDFALAEEIDDMVCREGHCDCHVGNGEKKLVAFSKPASGRFFRVKLAFPHDAPTPINFEVKHFALDKRTALAGMNTATYRLRGDVPETKGGIGRDRVVPLKSVVDVTDKLDPATGRVAWTAPKGGAWCLMRVGCAYNGAKCGPASKFGVGPEVDKLDAAAVGRHFDAYVGKFAKLPAVKATLVDSYEVGCQNWTPGLEKKFLARWGYSFVPYLACFSGRIVEGVGPSSDAFRDFRRLIAELFAENYAGGLRKKCKDAGIELAIEPYGNSPADNTSYAMNVDVPMTEFWVKKGDALPEGLSGTGERAVAGAAHFWGRKHVDAEAFTAHPDHGGKWLKDPFGLKAIGDWAYACGVTRMVYHRWAHQPWTEPARLPGMTMGQWGTHFERTETWWPMVGPWLKYQARCQFMLEQGIPVADLLYYVGDDAPNSGIPANPSKKLAWDAIGADGLKALMVANGRLVSPGGASYARLVVPEKARILPESLKELGRLRKAGATFVHGGRCDDGIMPDVVVYGAEKPVNWIHRSLPDGRELYFVAYGGDDAATIGCSFRQNGRAPEIWDAETGEIAPAARWRAKDGRAEVELDFKPCGSAFVVFGKPAKNALPKEIKPAKKSAPKRTVPVEGPWTLKFPQGWGCPESMPLKTLASWTTLPGEARYFSGIAQYVHVGADLRAALGDVAGKRVWLDLGDVKNLAEVTVNGKTFEPLWRPPFRLDVTDALAASKDRFTLSVRVANLWPNRLVGDAKKPMDHETFSDVWRRNAIREIPAWVREGKPSPTGRFTFTTWDHWRATDDLLPSGLLGPVKLEVVGR
ncbi:MAG: hypothetical protein MJ138_00430 [Kiritimatiellae bacterium]|nr:hypothetical protein [Kiritimatiellia bacterium]